MRNKMMVAAAGLFIFITGCSSKPLLPANGSQALKSDSEFGVLTAQPDVYQGRAIKLAGRMIGVEATAEGTIVRAQWLPYPNNDYEGPSEGNTVRRGEYAFFYPGKLDMDGSLHGNKFLVVGKMEGTKSMMTSVGSRNLPYLKASCLHVWKTGDAQIEYHQPDVENTGYPVMEETYCSDT